MDQPEMLLRTLLPHDAYWEDLEPKPPDPETDPHQSSEQSRE